MSALRRDGDDFLLFCRVQPRARANAFAEVRGSEVLVKLMAPPIDDRANQALRAFVGESSGVPISRVRIESGERARHKWIRITGASAAPAATLPFPEQQGSANWLDHKRSISMCRSVM